MRDVMNKRFVNRVDILETPGTRPYKYSKASMRRISFAYNDFLISCSWRRVMDEINDESLIFIKGFYYVHYT